MKITIPGCMSLAVHDRRWFVLRTKGGYDDQVFADLLDKGYEAYLPRSRTDKFNRRVRVFAERTNPLMPGYLFIVHPRKNAPIDDWREVRDIPGVLSPIGTSTAPLLIPPAVVEALMSSEFESVYDDTRAAKIMRGETSHSALEKRFKPGTMFTVKTGPFESFLATAQSLTVQDRVKALVEIFGRMVPVEFEPDQLEPARAT